MHTEMTSSDIQTIVLRERRLALSEREWKHRLRGYGYGIRDSEEGRVVTSLVNQAALCDLPTAIVN